MSTSHPSRLAVLVRNVIKQPNTCFSKGSTAGGPLHALLLQHSSVVPAISTRSSCSTTCHTDCERSAWGNFKRGLSRSKQCCVSLQVCEPEVATQPAPPANLTLAPPPRTAGRFRQCLLPGGRKRPPQFAAAMFGGVLPAALSSTQRRLLIHAARSATDTASALASVVLQPGTLLLARTPSGSEAKELKKHPEAQIVARLRKESMAALQGLSPVMLYSFKCPCMSCALAIASFARDHPDVAVAVAYEWTNVPDNAARYTGGICDASAVKEMQSAGVKVERITPQLDRSVHRGVG